MNKEYKIIISIVALAGLFSLAFNELSQGGVFLLIVVGLIIFIVFSIDKRFTTIEKSLSIPPDTYVDDKSAHRPLSYKLRINISIEWKKIVRKCFDNMSNDEQAWEIVKRIVSDSGINIYSMEGLITKEFQFVVFKDGLTGLEQIWSDYYKTFLDDIEISGFLFGGNSSLAFDKYPENKIESQFRIRPEYIGFSSDLPDGELMDEDMISQIPYHEIIHFLTQIYTNLEYENPMLCIKKFPHKLQELLEQNQVKYETWATEDYGCAVKFDNKLIESKWIKDNNLEICEQTMRRHIFTTPYYTVGIHMEVFG